VARLAGSDSAALDPCSLVGAHEPPVRAATDGLDRFRSHRSPYGGFGEDAHSSTRLLLERAILCPKLTRPFRVLGLK
jgi:hypothetical protein